MLEVLKQAIDYIENVPDDRDSVGHIDRHALVAALKERLAQPEQEPLAHWSDCAVHSEPAYPKSECDCGGIVAVADYTALSDKYVALSDKYVALKAQHKEQEPVAWLLTDKNINSLQVDSIQRLIDRLNHAHHTDVCVRINGQDEWFQADWLKHMVRVTPPQRTEQEPVAWMFQHDETGRMNYVSNDGIHNPTVFLEMNPRYALVCHLYTHPPQRTEQDPVKLPCCGYTDASAVKWNPFNRVVQCHNCGQTYTQPQRTWVGLTPEEFHEACWESYVDPVTGECSTGDREYAVRWTEAKLKQKNGFAEENT